MWAQLVSARNIEARELPTSVVHLIGVPRPVDAENRSTAAGEVRFSRRKMGVRFTAAILEQRERESITRGYAFAPDFFPPGDMHEYVALSGRYLDLGDMSFDLHALGDGTTRLEATTG